MYKQIIILIIFTFSINIFAQQTIKGKLIDKKTKEVLPYASLWIVGTNNGTITNSEGKFILGSKTKFSEIGVQFLGYNSQIIKINSTEKDIIIKLSKKDILINSVTIIGRKNEDIANIILKIVKNSNKYTNANIQSKAISRIFSIKNNTTPIELKEALYSANTNISEVRKLQIKSGRIGVNSKSDNYYSIDISNNFICQLYFFKKNTDDIYNMETPLIYRSAKKISNIFKLEYTDVDDSTAVINFKSLLTTGKIYFNKLNFDIYKLIFSKEYINKQVFKSININKKIVNTKMYFNINYHKINNKTLAINHLSFNSILYFKTVGTNNIDSVKTNYLIQFFDYFNAYNIPYYGIDRNFNDYEGVELTGFKQKLWQNNFAQRTKKESDFFNNYFNNNKKQITAFKYYTIQEITNNMQVKWSFMPKSISLKNKFKTFISCDFYNINGKNYFTVIPFLDYVNSYNSFEITNLFLITFNDYMNITLEESNYLKALLEEKYKNKKITMLDVKKELAQAYKRIQYRQQKFGKRYMK